MPVRFDRGILAESSCSRQAPINVNAVELFRCIDNSNYGGRGITKFENPAIIGLIHLQLFLGCIMKIESLQCERNDAKIRGPAKIFH
jgi:hypothetical protein